MTDEAPIKARVTHRFAALPTRVFDAWLDPAMIGKWMFGPAVREEEIVHITLDPQAGGSFSFLVRRDGNEIDHVGEYLEIARPRRLVFTWAIRENLPDSSRVVVEIVPLESGCELTLTHELHPDWADYVNRVETSWTKMLDALAAALR